MSDNPWERRVRSAVRGDAVRGLADVPISLNRTVLAYSTRPGDTALDGSGKNSPFAQALKEKLELPGVNVLELFNQVSVSVAHDTDGRQVPWFNSPGIGQTCIAACRQAIPASN